MKKNKGPFLPEVTAEIDAIRKQQGLAPLEENPKTLSEAKDILAGMKRSSKPSVRQTVATVAKAISAKTGDPDALADIQSRT